MGDFVVRRLFSAPVGDALTAWKNERGCRLQPLVKLVRTKERGRKEETLREEQIHPRRSKTTRRLTLVSDSSPLPVILSPLPSGCAVPFQAQLPATSPSPSPSLHPELRPTHHVKQVQIRHGSRSHAPADQSGAQVHDVWLYSSTLVATILLPPLPWFSSSSRQDMKPWLFKVIPGPTDKPRIAVDYKVYPCNACFLESEARCKQTAVFN
ncbi:uncharacterized protein LOC119357835 [Triticum dicoccoides]|uniref:uncharacterized protein LOC119357835 n=1 Tax=Triticum dicoccoides TaxID=85692 RepID=UPI00188F5EB0|nr:uncharacterized protein LOC119357835 [Triticum dicoccoides]